MRLAPLRLVGRQARADRWVAALLALVAAATVGFAVAALRLQDRAAADDVRAALARLRPADRDLSGQGPARPVDAEQDWAAALRHGPAQLLGDLGGEPTWSYRLPAAAITGPAGTQHLVSPRLGSGWAERVRVVEGRLPRGGEKGPFDIAARDVSPWANQWVMLETVMTTAVARAEQVRLGDTMVVSGDSGYPAAELRLRVVGLVDPVDPADEFWDDDRNAVTPTVFVRDVGGSSVTGTVFLDVGAAKLLEDNVDDSAGRLVARVPVHPGVIGRRDPRDVQNVLRAAGLGLSDPTTGTGLRLRSDVVGVLDRALERRRPLQAVSTVLLAVLLGAAGGALLLASRLLVHRRRVALAVARARGASVPQILAVFALEGLLVGAPPALLAALLARQVRDGEVAGHGDPLQVLLPVLVALTPAAALVVSTARQLASGRVPRPGTRRRVVDRYGSALLLVLLVVCAALAALALRTRGLDVAAGATGGPGDLLVVVAPVLVATAVTVLVARVAGPLLALVTPLAARRRGGVAFLGLARASREGAPIGVALVALSLALAAALLSAVAAATVSTGTSATVSTTAGGDLRLYGLGFTDADRRALAAVPGVQAVAPLAEPQQVTRQLLAGRAELFTLLATDAAALADVQRDLPDAKGFSGAFAPLLTPSGSGPLPVVASADLGPVGTTLQLAVQARPVPVRVVAVTAPFPGGPPTASFVVADLSALQARTSLVLAPQLVLARTTSPPPAVDAVRRAVPDASDVVTRQRLLDEAIGNPLVRAVRAGLPAALAVGAGYAGLAAVLALLLGARERGRFLAHLRALGLSGRQSGALVALEAVPAALAGLVAGVGAGLALTGLVLPTVDLKALTGSAQPPPVLVPLPTVGGVALAFLVVIGVAAGVAAAAGRAVAPAEASRTVEAA